MSPPTTSNIIPMPLEVCLWSFLGQNVKSNVVTKDTLLLLKKCFSENINVLLNTKPICSLFIAVKGSCFTLSYTHTTQWRQHNQRSANLVMASYLQQECRPGQQTTYLLLPQFWVLMPTYKRKYVQCKWQIQFLLSVGVYFAAKAHNSWSNCDSS